MNPRLPPAEPIVETMTISGLVIFFCVQKKNAIKSAIGDERGDENPLHHGAERSESVDEPSRASGRVRLTDVLRGRGRDERVGTEETKPDGRKESEIP